MSNKRNIINEAIEIRTRRGDQHRSVYVMRLNTLKDRFDKITQDDDLLLVYFPIAIVTTFEVYFRSCIQELIDIGPPYSVNAESLASVIKIDMGIINALQGKMVTIGEIISHAPSINKVEDINAHMTKLIGDDFLSGVKNTVDRWDDRASGGSASPILLDPDKTIRIIKKIFEDRHIFTHELPRSHPISRNDVSEYLEHAILFIEATENYIWTVIDPAGILSQSDMNQHANGQYEQEEKRLQDLLKILLDRAYDDENREALRSSQAAWEKFREAESNFVADEARGGSLAIFLYADCSAKMTRQRADEIEIHIGNKEDL